MTKYSFEQYINENGKLIYTNVGFSMYPLIKPRDLLVIKKVDRPLRRLDIPLFKYKDNGHYILHRILKKRDNRYILAGDNNLIKEKGVTDSDIIGLLTDIIRDGKTISVYSFRYRVYAHVMCDFFPLRRVIFWIRRVILNGK